MKNAPEFDDFIDEKILEEYKKKRLAELTVSPYSEIKARSTLLEKITTERCIIHFYKKEFQKCQIMNERVENVSNFFKDIRFYKVDAENFPDVCSYLHVKVLPFLGFFKDGKCVDSVIGFEGLGLEDFKIDDLINKIKNSDI